MFEPQPVSKNDALKLFKLFLDHITVALISPLVFLFEMGPEGVIVVHYSRGCYSDVGDARLCRELVKEGQGATNYKELYGQRKLINAEINKQFGPEFFLSLLSKYKPLS